MARPILGILPFALLAGCASTSATPAFRDVANLVEQRSGERIVWNQGGRDDDAIASKIRDLLSRELTVDGALQISLLNNRSLQAIYEDLSVAQADLVQAGLLRNPVFGVGVAFPMTSGVTTGANFSIIQDFLDVFFIAAKKRVAEAELRTVKLRVGDAVLHTTYQVACAFYNLVASQQIAAMRKTVLEAGDMAVDLARRQHEAGNINDLDLINHEAVYEQVRTDLVRSEAEVATAREELTRLLGLWKESAIYHVADQLPPMPADEMAPERLEALALTRRFDLAAAHEETEWASRALDLAKSRRWVGGTSLGATYERSPERYTTLGPNMTLELPIFDQKQADIARLEARLRMARARADALAVDARAEVRVARNRVVLARALVERYENVVVPLRQKAVALSQEQYGSMLLGTYQLLESKENEVNARRELIEALRDYWIARSDLERATGGNLHTEPSKTS